ncbi:MAG: hypothetical protein OEY03_14385 [Rhizobacter sp.]|nr:hypothetical protein [Rhizobacter sp.]
MTDKEVRRVAPRPSIRRLGWLLVCLAAGLAVGVAGSLVTGAQAWYLAVPAAIAIGWLFVADPTQCAPRKDDGASRS